MARSEPGAAAHGAVGRGDGRVAMRGGERRGERVSGGGGVTFVVFLNDDP